jgi:hypothetical protein
MNEINTSSTWMTTAQILNVFCKQKVIVSFLNGTSFTGTLKKGWGCYCIHDLKSDEVLIRFNEDDFKAIRIYTA